jgi:hypothetical protein
MLGVHNTAVPIEYAKRETTPKVRLEPKKSKRHKGAHGGSPNATLHLA